MTTVYNQPAVEIEQPGGEVVPYLCAAVPAPPGSWRAWRVTGPDGQTYVVSEYPSGRWTCTCAAFKFRGRRGADSCKHSVSVRAEVTGGTPDARLPHASR